VLAVVTEHVVVVPVSRLDGVHVTTGIVGGRLVKVIVTLFEVTEVPPCPSAAVAVAADVPGVARLYVVLVPVAAPVRLVLDHV